MKILITGGTGFIGTNLAEELRNRGHNVLTADLNHTPQTNRSHFRCDVGIYRQISRIFEEHQDIEFVFHLAAEYGRWNGEAFYELLWRTNCVGMKNVLLLQKKYNFKLTTFSSAEVYGDYLEIMKEDIMPSCVIYFTNGYRDSFPELPDFQTLWILTDKVNLIPQFGVVIYMV